MSDSSQNKKLGARLTIGGVIVALITLGGFYLSQNPDLIASWQYKQQDKKRDALRETIFTASPDCAHGDAALFKRVCAKLGDEGMSEPWEQGLSATEKTCLFESFKEVALFKLEYDGDPASHFEHMQDHDEIVVHACTVSEDLEYYRPDLKAGDAGAVLDAWYEYKKSEGNFFN